MIPILLAILYIAFLGYLAIRKQYFLVLFLFFIFGFTLRMASSVYIDVAGPVLSQQLLTHIGPGNSSTVLFLAYFSTYAPFLWVFRRSNLASTLRRVQMGQHPSALANYVQIFWVMSIAYVVFLYLDMFRLGTIPLLSQLERYEYLGGFFHERLVEWGNIFAFQLGFHYSLGILIRKEPDKRFFRLLLVLFGYLILAGHRFSAFYSYGGFFLIPLGAVLGIFHVQGQKFDYRRLISFNFRRGVVIAAVALGVAFSLYNSYVVVRSNERSDPFEKFFDRALIQPAELWWMTHERVFVYNELDREAAFEAVFIDPIVPDLNSSTPYLMYLALGQFAIRIVSQRFQYAGGYPEIVFELAGTVPGFLLLTGINYGFALFMFLLFRSVAEVRYFSTMLLAVVLWSLSIFYISGMLNFLVRWTFWVKVLAAITAVFVESPRIRRFVRSRNTASPALPGLV